METQSKGASPIIPLPFAEGNKASAAREPFHVVANYVVRMRTGNRPPDSDVLSGPILVRGNYFKYEELRFAVGSLLSHLVTTGILNVEFERRFHSGFQIANAGKIRSILVSHGEIGQKIL